MKEIFMKKLTITRIAHACTLLNFNGINILTDPWFSQKTGYYRGESLGMTIDKLPHLDAIVVSHAHYDHYDIDAFKQYHDKNVPFIVKNGTGDKARQAGFTHIIELDHWGSAAVNGIKITATPAKHKIPENTYVIEVDGMTLFFGADTLFIPELIEIGLKWPLIDVALLPVNGLSIRPLFNRQVVMSAYEAALLCAVLKPRIAIPIHYAFTGGYIRDKILLKYNGTAEEFVTEVKKKAPLTESHILETGYPFVVEYQ
jgi:L-ascorbate metabolism protein UlaG (beta-lactamase superfamily)